MKRRVLSMENDPRWEQYKLFSAYAFPCAGLTVPVDITGLYEWMQREKKPVFLTLLYLVSRAANRVPELRRRIEGGQVVEYDDCPTSFTEMKPDGSYAYYRMGSAQVPYGEYIAQGRSLQQQARRGGSLEVDEADESSRIFVSCVPWLNYTGIVQPMPIPADSNVRISWGKIFMRCGLSQVSVSLQVHHALADGYQMTLFYRYLDEEIAALCPPEEV